MNERRKQRIKDIKEKTFYYQQFKFYNNENKHQIVRSGYRSHDGWEYTVCFKNINLNVHAASVEQTIVING